ncbi:MAG: hypothetical protein GY851_26180, partial [bacterium]|nr:hypothetical protein [bacterium]
MRRISFAIAMSLALAMAASALDIPLTYEKYSDSRRDFRPMGRVMIKCQAGAPQGDWKLPELVSKQPVYGTYGLAGQKLMMLLDQQKASDPFFNRIYFDANNNRDLTDDAVIDGTVQSHGGNYYYSQFGACDVTLKVGDAALPFSFMPALNFMVPNPQGEAMSADNLAKYLTVYITTNCMYTGVVDLDGQHLQLMLGDANANGVFGDIAELPAVSAQQPNMYRVPSGDQLYISATKKLEYYDFLPLGQYLSVGGRLYAVSVDIAGGKMVLSEPEGTLVSAKLSMEADHLVLCSATSDTCIMLYQPGTQITVPAGSYIPAKYRALRNDEQGDLWGLVAYGTGN